MKDILKIIKKYLPDILILIGIWTFFYNVYFPSTLFPTIRIGHSDEFKFFGIILITIGINIAVRYYLNKKVKI